MTDKVQWLLGVDGGGTSTVAWVGKLSDRTQLCVVGRAEGGPCNLRSLGWATAVKHLQETIAAACDHAGILPGQLDAACLGIAGGATPAQQQAVREWFQQELASDCRTRLASDLDLVLASAERQMAGTEEAGRGIVAIIAGTGAVVGGQYQGRSMIQGGWGYLMDDIGSGYWLGKQALESAFRFLDEQSAGRSMDRNRSRAKTLSDRVLDRLGATSRSDLLDWLYSTDSPQQRVANLAELVFSTMSADRDAARAIQRGARALGSLAARLQSAWLPAGEPIVVALAGGVLVNQPEYRRLIKAEITSDPRVSNRVRVVEHPVEGALYLSTQGL